MYSYLQDWLECLLRFATNAYTSLCRVKGGPMSQCHCSVTVLDPSHDGALVSQDEAACIRKYNTSP